MTEVLGRPIVGTVRHYRSSPGEQKPLVELFDALDALLAFPEVEKVRWEQYTPYFNDGEPCEFGTGEVRIKITGDDESGDNGDGFIDNSGSYPPGYFDTHAYSTYVYDEYGRAMRDPNSRWGALLQAVPEGKIEARYKDREFYADGAIRNDIKGAFETFASHLGSGSYHADLLKHFGDPSEVTATADGFEVEDYDHE